VSVSTTQVLRKVCPGVGDIDEAHVLELDLAIFRGCRVRAAMFRAAQSVGLVPAPLMSPLASPL
jgi:hypothetical protein